MSLRDALQEAVARCAPQGMQHATLAREAATSPATHAQLPASLDRWSAATVDATCLQQGCCTTTATTPKLRQRSCSDCRHLSRVRTCREPVAAGLVPTFGIVWPEPRHARACPAWRRNPAEAVVAVLTAAGRGGWSDELMHQWLADADKHPEAVIDALRSGVTPA